MIHLVLGGARSGKSSFAESLALATEKKVFYVATATAGDNEMQQRIARHQQSRPQTWQLIEEPLKLSEVFEKIDTEECFFIIECMTLWLSNWLCADDGNGFIKEKENFLEIIQQAQSARAQSDQSNLDIVIVSNEVGSGIVPLGELSRQFVDEAGWLNQALAKVADKVTLVAAGCPLTLKPQVKTAGLL